MSKKKNKLTPKVQQIRTKFLLRSGLLAWRRCFAIAPPNPHPRLVGLKRMNRYFYLKFWNMRIKHQRDCNEILYDKSFIIGFCSRRNLTSKNFEGQTTKSFDIIAVQNIFQSGILSFFFYWNLCAKLAF